MTLEGQQEEVKFLAALSSRAEAALTGSLEVPSGTSGGEDKSALMHIDETTDPNTANTVSVPESPGSPLPSPSDGIKKQIAIVSDYSNKGSYEIAINLSKKALDDLTGDTTQCKVDRAIVLNTLALLYRDMDKPIHGIDLLKEALWLREELYGGVHLGVASIANNLAIFYSKIRQYELAEDSCKKSLSVKERLLGVESVEVARQVMCL